MFPVERYMSMLKSIYTNQYMAPPPLSVALPESSRMYELLELNLLSAESDEKEFESTLDMMINDFDLATPSDLATDTPRFVSMTAPPTSSFRAPPTFAQTNMNTLPKSKDDLTEARSAKLGFDSTFSPQTDAKNGVLNTEYKKDMVTFTDVAPPPQPLAL